MNGNKFLVNITPNLVLKLKLIYYSKNNGKGYALEEKYLIQNLVGF